MDPKRGGMCGTPVPLSQDENENMKADSKPTNTVPDYEEISEWIEAFDQIVAQEGSGVACELVEALVKRAHESGVDVPVQLNTPYQNTIPVEEEESYPGDRVLERRIKSLVRWNAMAMVHRQNKKDASA